jgi:exosortase A
MSLALAAHMPPARWRTALPAMAAVLLAIVVLYWDTFVAMAAIWKRSETFAHAWLVPPIVLWLIWRLRTELAAVTPKPQPWLLLPLAATAALWFLGDLAGVNAVAQFAVTALLALSVPAVLGVELARRILFPLAFLFFMVPFGEFSTDKMMDWTADFTVWALVATGIPVYREGLQFVIPSGTWSVVEACSGVRYLIASFMVGTLFAYLNYNSPWRRWSFVAVSIVVPIVANWLRAYMIVMLGHLSGNKLAVGVDHLIYGWVFFGLVIGVMFFIGARFTEAPAEPEPARPATGGEKGAVSLAALAGVLAVAVAPHLAGWLLQDPHRTDPVQLEAMKSGEAVALSATEIPYEPVAEAAAATQTMRLSEPGGTLYLHLAYYRAQTYGAKMTSSNNVFVQSTDKVWSRQASVDPSIPYQGESLRLRGASLASGPVGAITGRRLLQVRQVYWIDGRFTADPRRATVYTLLSRLSGRGDDGAIVTLYLEGPPAEGERLDAAVARWLPRIDQHLRGVRQAR